MRILLLGKNGQLGWELHRTLSPLGEIVAADYPQVDVTRLEDISEIVIDTKPALIVNATAYTEVDRAESEPETARAVNTLAPGFLAELASKYRAAFIHYSTDYVFNGGKGEPYSETDKPDTINVYGESKLAGEVAIQQIGTAFFILRTSWVYSMRSSSFVTKVLDWAKRQETLKIVEDQVGSPTWARMLAETSAQLVGMGKRDIYSWIDSHRGIYHLAGEGAASRFEWAQAILRFHPNPSEIKARYILPVNSAEFPTSADRPKFSALNCQRFIDTFGLRLPAWEYTLQLALDNIK